MLNQQQTQTTKFSQRHLKEALETILPFATDKEAKKEGLDSVQFSKGVFLDLTNNNIFTTDCGRMALVKLEQLIEEDFFNTPLEGQYVLSAKEAKE